MRPAVSLYVETTPEGVPLRHATRVDRVPVAANLRLDEVGEAFANDLPSPSDPPWTAEFRALWKLARHLSAARGKNDIQRIDYSFYVDWDAISETGEPGRVSIVPRPRGSPLDKLIAELMIHVNSTWGRVAGRARRGRALSHAVDGQGQDEHPAGRAPGARPDALPVGELAACAATATSSTSGSCSR